MISLLDDDMGGHPVQWINGQWEWVEAIEAPVLPELPAEVWQTRPVDAEKAMAAARAMSR